MTIPIYDLPALGFNQVSFDLVVPRSVNRLGGRLTESVMFGTPYWVASYQIVPLDYQQAGQADAWVRRLLARGGVFKAYDASRPRPIEFSASPISWTPTLFSIPNGNTPIVTGLPANAQLRAGDYVAFKMSDLVVSLHSIAEDAQANGSGAVTLSIDPALDTDIFTTAAVPIFEKPYCLMQITEWSATKPVFGTAPSFSAAEVFFYEDEGEEEGEEEE